MNRTTRRGFLGAGLAGLAGARFASALSPSPTADDWSHAGEGFLANAPVETITGGPKHHWFGYYDKLEFDPSDGLVLANEIDFEHRSPRPEDAVTVGYVDLEAKSGFRPFPIDDAETHAFSWQQGCMLQWRPGHGRQAIWNVRRGDSFGAVLHDLDRNKTTALPHPIYALAPDGKWAITCDFARLDLMRPGYGYAGVEIERLERAPADSGIWRLDLDTGRADLLLSLADVVRVAHHDDSMTAAWHWFNHLLVNPDGSRFTFLHRWRPGDADPRERRGGRFITRMFTADADGSDLYCIDPSGHTSHFIWRDPETICAWTRPEGKRDGFYMLKDKKGVVGQVGEGVMTRNGHNTYLPVGDGRREGEWILNDTYPDAERRQTLYLYHVPSGRRFDLGRFKSPPKYSGEWRCDLHPRSNRAGTRVAIDSPHNGEGRQIHLVDIREILEKG